MNVISLLACTALERSVVVFLNVVIASGGG